MMDYLATREAEMLLAEIGLLLFLMVFVSVLVGAWRRPRQQVERLAAMPLEIQDYAEAATAPTPSADNSSWSTR